MKHALLATVLALGWPLAVFAADEAPPPKPVGPPPAPVDPPAGPVVAPGGLGVAPFGAVTPFPAPQSVPGAGLHGQPFPVQCPPFVMDTPNDLLPPGSPYLSYADTKGRWYSPYHVMYTIPVASQREILRAKDSRYPIIKPKKDETPEKKPDDKPVDKPEEK